MDQYVLTAIGKIEQVLNLDTVTDDVFKSTVHRAANRSGARRYSIPLFFGTDYDVLLEVGRHTLLPQRRGL